MKKITAVLLILSYILANFSLSAFAYYDVDDIIISGYVQSDKVGNIFALTDEKIRFSQSYENITEQSVQIQSVYQVWDESGMIVRNILHE